MKKGILALTGTFVLGASALGGAANHLSDLLLFRERPKEEWTNPQKPACSQWMREYAYADLTQGTPGSKPVDFTCEEALAHPGESFKVSSDSGMAVHYKVYQNPRDGDAYAGFPQMAAKAPPFLLHIHGVSGSHLHGARYFKMASRLGFQLVAMDLSNHGLSEHNGKGAGYGCRESPDVLAVIGALLRSSPDRDILIHATSMGAMALGNAASQLTALDARHRIVAAVIENPIPSVRRVVDESPHRPPVPAFLIDVGMALAHARSGYNFEACRPIDGYKGLTLPAAVLHAQPDDLVPEKLAREVFNSLPKALPNVYKVYPRGSHSAVWNGSPAEYEADVMDIWRTGLRYRSEGLLGQTR